MVVALVAREMTGEEEKEEGLRAAGIFVLNVVRELCYLLCDMFIA